MNISEYPGIYIHIPFCQSKCGYCDFYSDTNLKLIENFLAALSVEINQYSHYADKKTVFDTIYLGGGTPSVLHPEQIYFILELLRKNFMFHTDTEITIEINPGTSDTSFLQEYLAMGIRRVSIGVQSFSDRDLKFLGRIHSARDAYKAINKTFQSGFENVNIDLIYALPGQNLADWKNSLHIASRLGTQHISAYNLSIEQGTLFHELHSSGKIKELSPEKEAEFFSLTHDFLTNSGYMHYEVSNFARNENRFSRHNYKYWNHTPYLSFGPSAHSFWNNKRWQNIPSVAQYIARLNENQSATDQSEELTRHQLMFESVFLGLRTYAGINLEQFKKDHDTDFNILYADQIDSLQKSGHAQLINETFVLTQSGMLICDEISTQFII